MEWEKGMRGKERIRGKLGFFQIFWDLEKLRYIGFMRFFVLGMMGNGGILKP
jgi:hypothetical protein